MIKGKRKNLLTVDDILQHTNGGHDIYMSYLGKAARLMSRPWGRKEKKMSWGVFPKNGVWFWKDQANEETGNAITFVQRYFGLTHAEAKDKIIWDFGMGGGKETNKSPIIVTWTAPEERSYMPINFSSKPFEKRHHAFWNAAEVPEEHCLKMECYAVKDLAINKKKVVIKPGEIVFAFYCKEEDAVKIYFPEREKDERFRNNVSFHHLWNYNNIKDCDDLIVQKSPKDMIVTTMVSPCCIATQAEAVKIFDEATVAMINQISKGPWIWYGSDWDGVKKCKEITDTNKWKYINTPKNLLPDINDAYGYACRFGLNGLEEFMRTKKLIR